MLFADVILPLPIAGHYTYSIPEEWERKVVPGCRVLVHFGKKKYYTAIVWRTHGTAPEHYDTKPIADLLDTSPIVFPHQLDLWQWIADYYLCTPGDVYKAALPAGLKPESETVVTYNEDFQAETPLTPQEQTVLNILQQAKELLVSRLEKHLKGQNALPTVRRLLEKQAIHIKEEVQQEYRPKNVWHVRLTDNIRTEEAMHRYMDTLARAPKQLTLLMKFVQLTDWTEETAHNRHSVERKQLLSAADTTAAVLQNLTEKGIFEIFAQEVGRLDNSATELIPLQPLTPIQETAKQEIQQAFREKDICLLHGVTSSGKTEIYIHLIEDAIRQGKQVLYLLPEIALTTQITSRLRKVFGNRLGIYHSKYPDAQRVEVWKKQLSDNDYDVIIGVRSSVFLPFKRLGLVIVDEEHENTYKQQDPAPRYHARNTAIMLAKQAGARVLLGTATPSIESYYNAVNGKYGLVQLNERHGKIQLPRIVPVDTKELTRKKLMKGVFSPFLLQQMREAFARKEQVILFQNRRGFAPMITCNVCAWVPRCKHCDVSLTYHKHLRQLTCHYCGYTYQIPAVCPACESTELHCVGYGTERIEEAVKEFFPDVKAARMDLDTTRSRTAYERIIADFQSGRTELLIGTQMISKGLDFDNVSVVGILHADGMLSFPDFRSYERAFQLMAQVAGRAGRRSRQGLVVLQTKSPELPLISQILHNDYAAMYESQVAERKAFKYPPLYRLVYVYLKHRKEDVAEEAAQCMGTYLRQGLSERVLGPDRPAVARIQALHIRKLMIKIEPSLSMSRVKQFLQDVRQAIIDDSRFRSIQLYYDVDPM